MASSRFDSQTQKHFFLRFLLDYAISIDTGAMVVDSNGGKEEANRRTKYGGGGGQRTNGGNEANSNTATRT